MEELEQKSKYYQPKIEEFYVGFEYEEGFNKYHDLNICDTEWDKCVYRQDSFLHIVCDVEYEFSLQEEIDNNLIRVKYLDKSDIEEFGFKYKNIGIVPNRPAESCDRPRFCISKLIDGRQLDNIQAEIAKNIDYTPEFIDYFEIRFTNEKDWSAGIEITKQEKPFAYNGHLIFKGIIKNKSELKKVLLMLGVV